MEDRDIVNLFIKRDMEAINHTKEKYGKRLRRLAYEITEDTQAAEECENDVYLSAWNSIPPHEPYDYLYPFLLHIVRNAALNYCRSRKTQKRKTSTEALTAELENIIPGRSDIEELIDDMQLKELLNGFLGQLSEEMRSVFIRRYWYTDSVERIAKGYGMSISKVKSILFRCRRKFRDYLEKEGYTL